MKRHRQPRYLGCYHPASDSIAWLRLSSTLPPHEPTPPFAFVLILLASAVIFVATLVLAPLPALHAANASAFYGLKSDAELAAPSDGPTEERELMLKYLTAALASP